VNRFTGLHGPPLGTVRRMPSAARTPKPAATKPPAALSAVGDAVRRFAGLQDWIEVFKAGTHTDSAGNEASFTRADLEQMAANVAGAGVPAVIGHPESDAAPAYAWAKPGDVKVTDDDRLFVKFSDINPDFQAGVDMGAWRERSIKIYRDKLRGWVLAHVGFLGAAPPAIAGMQALAYSGQAPADAEVHTFSSSMDVGWAMGDVAAALRRMRDWLISTAGLETADAVMPGWSIDSISNAATRINEAARAEPMGNALGTAYAAPGAAANPGQAGNPQEHHMPSPTGAAAPAAAPAAAQTFTRAQLDEALAQERAQFAAQGQELAELRAQRQAERIGAQIEGWKAAGVLPPALEPGMAQFMAALEGGQAGEFAFSSAAGAAETKQTPAQWFAAFMGQLKPLVQLGARSAAADTDPGETEGTGTPSNREIADRAAAYQRQMADQGRVISISQALDAVAAGKDKPKA